MLELDFEGIIAFLRGQKAAVLQLPERIEFVEVMPYSGVQKIDKQALREDIRQKIEAEAAAADAPEA